LWRVLFEQREIAGREAGVDPNVLVLLPAETAQRLRKGRRKGLRARIVLGKEIQGPNASHPLGLLCVSGEQRCRLPASTAMNLRRLIR
jgi:hypothetical protein